MEYIDSNAKVRFVVPQTSWFCVQHPTPSTSVETWASIVDIEGGDDQSFVLFVQVEDRRVLVAKSAREPAGDLDYDHWNVKITVTSDDAVGFEGLLGFTFTKHGMPPDVPAFKKTKSVKPLVKQP